jgi:hypothetical protein
MSTRFWAREYAVLGGVVNTGPPYTNTVFPLVSAPGTTNPNSIVKRMFLDARLSFYWNAGGVPQPTFPWWTGVSIMVSGGVTDSTELPRVRPFIVGFPRWGQDHRVTLTGMLKAEATPGTADPDRSSVMFSGSFETQGARKSPTPGDPPTGCTFFYIEDTFGLLVDPTLQLTMFGFAYLRVLYEDP